MIKERELAYRKACTEIYEILKNLDQTELSRIPQKFMNNVELNMDKNYHCELDGTKSLSEQNLLPETKALIIQIYERYLCPDSQKEKWEKYDSICNEMIEEEKRKKYNPDDLFKNPVKQEMVELENASAQMIEYKEENRFQKVISKIKEFLRIKFK